MVKDEDVCLHCGLCAERCPTGAWDMQKFLLNMSHASGSARMREGLSEPADSPRPESAAGSADGIGARAPAARGRRTISWSSSPT